MPASRKVNPDQFKLFFGGQELKETITDSGDRRLNSKSQEESMDKMWARKSKMAKGTDPSYHGAGVYKSIKQVGYRGDPVPLMKTKENLLAYEGHHRIAAAADVEKTGKQVWVPVEYL